MIPSTIDPSVRSVAEKRIFRIIQEAPGTGDWVCLHSLGLARHVTKRRGEIDFLLLTQKGIFVLEVKGGRVARQDGFWIFTDRYGIPHRKQEGPFHQASSAMFSLEEDVRRHFGSNSRMSNLLFGYGVVLPDIEFEATGCDADRRLVYDSRDRRAPFGNYITRLSQFASSHQQRARHLPTTIDITSLTACLRGNFDLTPLLSVRAEEVGEHLAALTEEQYCVVDLLADKPRCLVQGGAGTGKTFLAARSARTEIVAGRSVLVLCFNRVLAAFLNRTVCAGGGKSKMTIASVHQFMEQLIRRSTLHADFQRHRSETKEFYGEVYPEYAQLAVMDLGFEPFDVLIIDEAQDMLNHRMLDFFDGLVKGGIEAGSWRVFFDANNQSAVYGSFDPAALARLERFGTTAVLTVNCRNTKQVADETTMLAQPKVHSRARSEGIAVEYSWYKGADEQPKILARVLDRLLQRHLPPGRITVLSPLSESSCCAVKVEGFTLHPVTEQNVANVVAGDYEYITFSTVSSFKGLENDFIVFTDLADLESAWSRSILYVGMSRARFGLCPVLEGKLEPVYRERVQQWVARALARVSDNLK